MATVLLDTDRKMGKHRSETLQSPHPKSVGPPTVLSIHSALWPQNTPYPLATWATAVEVFELVQNYNSHQESRLKSIL